MVVPAGLTDEEVAERRSDGRVNETEGSSGRSYWDITRANLFSYFNIILFSVGAILAVLGQTNDAFVTASLGVINAVIGTIQEIRAKQQLERIAVLARPTVTVVRGGQLQEVTTAEVVEGDIIRLAVGDQAVVDGRLLEDCTLEMDESLLTGETDLIKKGPEDQIYSGSFCVTGEGYFEAQKVGNDSFANKLTEAARTFEPMQTPLQTNVNYAIQLMMVLAVIMGIIFYVAGFIQDFSFLENVKATAVLTGLVPYGLFLTIVVTYALGSLKIANEGALVQQSNAIESLNNVDVLCMDKTGTLTANRLCLNEILPVSDMPAAEISAALGSFVRSVASSNSTNEAILSMTQGTQLASVDEVPFSSARKWSALAFDNLGSEGGLHGAFVLGAVEMMASSLVGDTSKLHVSAAALSDKGLRVLLFAHNATTIQLHGVDENPALPELTPLALVTISDELRPKVEETLKAFSDLGVQLKIISGDNPQTVAALAKQAGFDSPRLVSGPELADMSEVEIATAAEEASIFGRITPEQKQALVDALIDKGHYVAMMGDGVNDVLSLKKAKLGIAMQSGSNATRNVADMVLLDDSYAALVPALSEGKRIINGISDATYLLMARGLCYAFVIIAVMMVGLDFPFEPSQLGLTTFSVGFPAFILTLWARPEEREESLLLSILRFVLPFALLTMLLGVILYAYFNFQVNDRFAEEPLPDRAITRFEEATGLVYGEDADFNDVVVTLISQTNLSNFLSISTMLLVLFLHPPIEYFAVYRPLSPDRRPALLTVGLVCLYIAILELPAVTSYFGIVGSPTWVWGILVGFLIVWMLSFRIILKRQWVDKLLMPS